MLEFCNTVQMHLAVTWLFQNSQRATVKVKREGCSLLSAGAPHGAIRRDTSDEQ